MPCWWKTVQQCEVVPSISLNHLHRYLPVSVVSDCDCLAFLNDMLVGNHMPQFGDEEPEPDEVDGLGCDGVIGFVGGDLFGSVFLAICLDFSVRLGLLNSILKTPLPPSR